MYGTKEGKVLEKMRIIGIFVLPFVLVFLLSLVVPMFTATRYDSTNSTSISPPSTPIIQKESNGSFNLVIMPQASQNHWWTIDYWATSGDQLPPKMNGTFTAVANSISGLTSGDIVLYLPLNVAYGTSSDNCVWFQFDVQFSSGGFASWYIWDVLGPASDVSADFHFQVIGISYIVGDGYNFELTTSGTNTVTFSIKDITSGASWSTSSWKWTVPSLTMLYDPLVFSPASAVEGYTTNTQLANFPYFQTYVGYNLPTVSGPVVYGSGMPSTIGIQVSGGPVYYWWSMFTPPPTVTVTATGLSEPRGVAVTPNGEYAYVTNGASNSVSVISTATNTVTATIPVGSDPLGVAVTPNGAYAYVTNIGSNSVSVISTATNTVTATIPVGNMPFGVAVTPDGAYAYVTNSYDSNTISVISTATNAVTATIPIDFDCYGMAITPDGAHVYVTNVYGYVSVINTVTNTVTANINLERNLRGVAVTPDGAYAYVTDSGNGLGNGAVSVINTATNTVTATITGISEPSDIEGVAVTPDGAYAYITNYGSNSVSVISTATNTVTATIPVGGSPVGVAVTPNGAYAYITSSNTPGSVSVINTATNTVKAALTGIAPSGPLTMDVGQVQMFTATPSGGWGAIHYQWYVDAVAVGTDSSAYSYTVSGISASVTCKVTDSASPPVTSPASNAVSVTVNSALVPPTVTPNSGTVDQGQTISLTSTAVTTGTAPYTYEWFEMAPGGSYVTVGSNSITFSFVTSGTTTTGSWSFILKVTDATGAAVKSTAVLVTVNTALVAGVRGCDNCIYYSIYDSTAVSWCGWTSLPSGCTIDSPAATVVSDTLYVVVRGMDGASLWFSSVNLTDSSFSGWALLSGSTPSAPTLTSNGTALALVVRGEDNRLYYCICTIATQTWTGWSALPSGWTIDSSAASLVGNELYIVVRGMDGASLWSSNINPTTNFFSGWTLLSGASPSAPTLATFGTTLALVVQGEDNHIYYCTYSIATQVWTSWSALPSGTTPDSPAATILGNTLYITVVGSDGNGDIYQSSVNLGTSAFSGWTLLSGSTPSKLTLTS